MQNLKPQIKTQNLSDIVLVSNSPGELSALVKPLIMKFREKVAEIRLTLIITPCQYQSGKEKEFADNLNLDQILTPKEYKKLAIKGEIPKGMSFGTEGKVLFTGGDLLHAVLIAKRLKYKAYAYLGEYLAWPNQYEKFFVADEAALRKFSSSAAVRNKLVQTGNLMADSISQADCITNLPVNPNQPVVTFLPGSRKFQINYLIPYYLKIFDLLYAKSPEAQIVISLSPFTNGEQIEKASKGKIKLTTSGEHSLFEYNDHTIFVINKPFSETTLAVTIPGTNTAQLALLGIPMLVVFPLDKPEVIPLEGLGNIIDKIPLLGYGFKKLVAHIIQKRTKFWALPNIKADQEIVPELVGKITPEDVARKITQLLKTPYILATMKSKLPSSFGSKGAADKIVEEILKNQGLIF